MKEENGLPVVGSRFAELGVRPTKDIPVSSDGIVQPKTGGMSVSPSLRSLHPFLVPPHLEHLVEGARGPKNGRCFKSGNGEYQNGLYAEKLLLRIEKNGIHGLIEPDSVMELNELRLALEATRATWTIAED